MKKLIIVLLALVCSRVFSELPIPETHFRKASLETIQKYAVQNRPEAQLELALRYYAGHQVSQNSKEAFSWMSRAAE